VSSIVPLSRSPYRAPATGERARGQGRAARPHAERSRRRAPNGGAGQRSGPLTVSAPWQDAWLGRTTTGTSRPAGWLELQAVRGAKRSAWLGRARLCDGPGWPQAMSEAMPGRAVLARVH
jgi:hypothetical protein